MMAFVGGGGAAAARPAIEEAKNHVLLYTPPPPAPPPPPVQGGPAPPVLAITNLTFAAIATTIRTTDVIPRQDTWNSEYRTEGIQDPGVQAELDALKARIPLLPEILQGVNFDPINAAKTGPAYLQRYIYEHSRIMIDYSRESSMVGVPATLPGQPAPFGGETMFSLFRDGCGKAFLASCAQHLWQSWPDTACKLLLLQNVTTISQFHAIASSFDDLLVSKTGPVLHTKGYDYCVPRIEELCRTLRAFMAKVYKSAISDATALQWLRNALEYVRLSLETKGNGMRSMLPAKTFQYRVERRKKMPKAVRLMLD